LCIVHLAGNINSNVMARFNAEKMGGYIIIIIENICNCWYPSIKIIRTRIEKRVL